MLKRVRDAAKDPLGNPHIGKEIYKKTREVFHSGGKRYTHFKDNGKKNNPSAFA
jgi:hypothetical protein